MIGYVGYARPRRMRGLGALPGQAPAPIGTTPVPVSSLPAGSIQYDTAAYPLSPGLVYLARGPAAGTVITAADAAANGIPTINIQNAWTLEDPCSDYSWMVEQVAGNAQAGIYRNQLKAQGAPQSQIDAVRDSATGRPGPRIPILADNSPLAVFLQNWTAQAIANPSSVIGPQCPGQQCNAMYAAGNAAAQFCAGSAPGVTSAPMFDPTKQPTIIATPTAANPLAVTTITPAAVAAAAQAAAAAAPSNVTPPTVVNPSPATQATTTGSTVASPISALSIANGGSLQPAATGDIIAGIPNEFLLIGAAGLAVLFLFMAGGK